MTHGVTFWCSRAEPQGGKRKSKNQSSRVTERGNSLSILWCTVPGWFGRQLSCDRLCSPLAPGSGPRWILPHYRTLARDSVQRCSGFSVFHPLAATRCLFSFLQLSISMQISYPEPINLQTFQQSLYCCSPVSCAFTQMQLFNVSSSFFHSNDSTPTSALPEEENIFPLFLFYVDRGSRVSGFTGFLLLVIQLPNAESPTAPLILLCFNASLCNP